MRIAIGLMLLSLGHALCLFGQDSRVAAHLRAPDMAPLVTLSISDEIAGRGDRMRVWFGTAKNAHITVFRIDTDGRVRMLYPERPWHDTFVQAGRMLEIETPSCDQGNCAFVVDDYPGQGYVFAIASTSPFDFDRIANGDYWDYTNIAHGGRVVGDPFVALAAFMDRILPSPGDGESSYDVHEYFVGQRYEYPRFLCYECHSFVQFPAWNPYQRECPRYQIVRFDAAAYHSATGYSPTRVVFPSSEKLDAQFIFKARVADDPFLSVVADRPVRGDVATDRGDRATAAEVGGIGAVPAPLGRRNTLSERDLRRLTEPDSLVREPPTSQVRELTPTVRPRTRLLRRRRAKPDSIPDLVKVRPDTSQTPYTRNLPPI